MKKDKKRIVGIVLLVLGVIGLCGIPSSDDKIPLLIGCLIVLAVGGILMYLSIKGIKKQSNVFTSKSNDSANSTYTMSHTPSSPIIKSSQTTYAPTRTASFPDSRSNRTTTSKSVEPDYRDINANETIEKYVATDHTDHPAVFQFSHYKLAEFKCMLKSLKRAEVLLDLSKTRKKRVTTEFGYYSTVKIKKSTDLSVLGRFIVIDTETTGLNPKNDRIIELSAIKFDKFRPVEIFSTYLDPKRHIPNSASEITGIDDELIQGSPIYAQIQESFEKYIKGYNLIFHNARFDLAFLHYSGTSIDTDNQQVFDTLELARKHLKDEKGNAFSSYSLEIACAYRNIGIADSHSAESDALATGLLFNEIIKEVSGNIDLNVLLDA